MELNKILLDEFNMEMAGTRKTLERIPEEKLTWKPHEKSFSFIELGSHLTDSFRFGLHILQQDQYDLKPGSSNTANSPKELLERFDKSIAELRSAIENITNEELAKEWSLLIQGKKVMSMPRINAIRRFIFSHNIHHRGQLTVYLRLNNIPVPPVYGSSADEKAI